MPAFEAGNRLTVDGIARIARSGIRVIPGLLGVFGAFGVIGVPVFGTRGTQFRWP